jgi:hypothetical protein
MVERSLVWRCDIPPPPLCLPLPWYLAWFPLFEKTMGLVLLSSGSCQSPIKQKMYFAIRRREQSSRNPPSSPISSDFHMSDLRMQNNSSHQKQSINFRRNLLPRLRYDKSTFVWTAVVCTISCSAALCRENCPRCHKGTKRA